MTTTRDHIEKLKIAASNRITKFLDCLGITYSDCGAYLKGSCPAKNHGGDRDNQSAFCWWPDTRSWACFSHHCNVDVGSDIIGLICAVKGYNFQQALKFLEDFVLDKLEMSSDQVQNVEIISIKREQHNKRIHENRLKFLQQDKDSLSSLLERGFSIEVLQKFDVGFWTRLGSFMHDRIVIPVRDYDGYIVGFTGRTIWPEEEWQQHGINEKWKHGLDYVQNIKGSFHKSSVVFNLNNAKIYINDNDKSIFIVEGPYDGFKLSMAGIENWVACLGSYFSTSQRALLIKAGVSRVKLAFDNDGAGRKATQTLIKNLSEYFHVDVIDLPDGCDPGDLTVDQIKDIFLS